MEITSTLIRKQQFKKKKNRMKERYNMILFSQLKNPKH